MTKIVVPEGMLNVISAALTNNCLIAPSMDRRETLVQSRLLGAQICQWLSENPIRPTLDQQFALHDAWPKSLIYEENSPHPIQDQIFFSVVEWQRRMFLAPEPEVPEEVRDLLWRNRAITPADESVEESDRRIIEAYRRGQKAGLK